MSLILFWHLLSSPFLYRIPRVGLVGLFLCISFNEIHDINARNGTIAARFRCYGVWHPTLQGTPESSPDKAKALFLEYVKEARKKYKSSNGKIQSISVKKDKVEEFLNTIKSPKLMFPLAIELERIAEPRIKVYANQFIVWNCAYPINRANHVCHKIAI